MLSFEEFVGHTQGETSVSGLRQCFERCMLEEGFENYFNLRLPDLVAARARWLKVPPGFLETYTAEGWEKIDPILHVMARARRPFFWDDVEPHLRLTRDQGKLLRECNRVGVRSIIAVPFQDPGGACDVVGISRRSRGQINRERLPILEAFCAQTWCRFADLSGDSLAQEPTEASLTPRETEILQRVKDGSSNLDIAERTGLSVKTVEYHVGNILKKLKASNRLAAVVIAIRTRLLPL